MDTEIEAVEKEAEEAIEQQRALFGNEPNTPPEDEKESEKDPEEKEDGLNAE